MHSGTQEVTKGYNRRTTMDKWPKWEAKTAEVADIEDVTWADIVGMLKLIHEHGEKERNKAMKYAASTDWPEGWSGFGADLYQTYGVTMAERFRVAMHDEDFRKR
jgi:hypothetical protein